MSFPFMAKDIVFHLLKSSHSSIPYILIEMSPWCLVFDLFIYFVYWSSVRWIAGKYYFHSVGCFFISKIESLAVQKLFLVSWGCVCNLLVLMPSLLGSVWKPSQGWWVQVYSLLTPLSHSSCQVLYWGPCHTWNWAFVQGEKERSSFNFSTFSYLVWSAPSVKDSDFSPVCVVGPWKSHVVWGVWAYACVLIRWFCFLISSV